MASQHVVSTGSATADHFERLAAKLSKVARAAAGMLQREHADAAHVESTVARIEAGARQPSLPVLERILAAIDLGSGMQMLNLRTPLGGLDLTSRRQGF